MTALVTDTPPIVTSDWLIDHLDSVTVLDTRRALDFLEAHVPGARSLPLGGLVIEDTGAASLVRLGRAVQDALGNRGIVPDDHLVLVDDNDGSASVGVFLCELAGVAAVSALHGGNRAWLQAGNEVEHGLSAPQPVPFVAEVSIASVASIDDLRAAHTSGARLVDTRSQLEHEGIVGSPCCAYRGHVPGSLHLEWTSLLSATGDLHGPDRIRDEAHQIGLEEDDDIIVYCHSGQRSAVAGLALRAAGFRNVRNSLGSWHEWAHRGLPAAPER